MVLYIKPAAINGQCCACNQYSNCGCGGVASTLQCRSKADNATLCGWEEFTTPSVPPRKFLTKTISGTMHLGSWSVTGCPDGAGDHVSYSGGWSPGTDFWGDSSGSMAALPIEIDVSGNRVKYELTGKSWSRSTVSTPWGTAADPFCPYDLQLIAVPVGGGSAQVLSNIGDTVWLSRASAWTFSIQGFWPIGGWFGHTETELEIDVANVVDLSTRDVWDKEQTFDPYDCNLETIDTTDTSSRHTKAFSSFPLASGGDEVTWPGGEPHTAYGALTETTVEATERVTAGKEDCQGSGPYAKAEGEVREPLTNEDTEEDAIERETTGMSWSAEGLCQNHTSYRTQRGAGEFSVAFRNGQTRAILYGLTVDHQYSVRFRIWRRTFDAESPYAYYADLVVTITATAIEQNTEWYDIPNNAGYETRSMSCFAIEV